MSETNKEQHPLLCDEESDQEGSAPEYQRRYRPLVYKGRARVAAKGASVIVTRWPEHWTSLVGFWWFAVSMFAISTFIIYRTIIVFSIMPSIHGRSFYSHGDAYRSENSSSNTSQTVYMHVFVNDYDEINLLNYMPHVKKIAVNNSNFNFKFIIVFKDVNTDLYSLSAEEHNTAALNSLWNDEKIKTKDIAGKTNVQIEHTTLSKCMDSSPLRKYWKHLPPQLVEYLVRAVSIWERGGIAINPDILTPRTPNDKYLEKFNDILKFYGKPNITKSYSPVIDKKMNLKKQDKNKIKKVNNIRDIIDNMILENDDSLSTEDTLIGLDDTHDVVVVHSKRKLLAASTQDVGNDIDVETTSFRNTMPFVILNNKGDDYSKTNDNTFTTYAIDTDKSSRPIIKSQNLGPQFSKSSNLRMLPLFFEFIFKDKVQFDEPKIHAKRQRKSVIPLNTKSKSTDKDIDVFFENSKKDAEIIGPQYKPMIISAKGMQPDILASSTEANVNLGKYEKYQLTIDLRGNILATETPCHAFLGTIFSNVMQHTQEESLKDFIIAELSLFCKGLLSSCRGIDLVLL